MIRCRCLDAGYTERYMGLDTPEDNQAGYNVRLNNNYT